MIYPIKLSQLLEKTKGVLLNGASEELIYSFSTDSRTLKAGDFFIAVKGDNFDGHKFVCDAVKHGAKGIIISEDITQDIPCAVIKVDNTLNAYLEAASIYLDNFNVKKIGITGSVGKTTTKEIMAHILEAKYKVLKPIGSFNNEIGIPKTIFNLEKGYNILLLELAMRGSGQISQLCEAVQPDIGVITTIGESHYEFMGSYDKIAEAKAGLLESLRPEGLAVINNDDKFADFLKNKTKAEIITYAIYKDADFKAFDIENNGFDGLEFSLRVKKGGEATFKTNLLGQFNISNILASLAVGFYLDVPFELMREKVKTSPAPYRRMQKKTLANGIILIDDCYNASPTSMLNALDFIGGIKIKGKKIAVLADMLELGKIGDESHYNAGLNAAKNEFNFLILLGNMAKVIKDGALEAGFPTKDIFIANSNREAADKLKEIIKKDDVILLKGSRKMKLEEIEEELSK